MVCFSIVKNVLQIHNKKVINLSLEKIDQKLNKLNTNRSNKKLKVIYDMDQKMCNFINITFLELESLEINAESSNKLINVDLSILKINELNFVVVFLFDTDIINIKKPKLKKLTIFPLFKRDITIKNIAKLSYQTQYLGLINIDIKYEQIMPVFNPDCFIHVLGDSINDYLLLCLELVKQQIQVHLSMSYYEAFLLNKKCFFSLNSHILNTLLDYDDYFHIDLKMFKNKLFTKLKNHDIDNFTIDDNSKYVLKKYLNKEKSNILLYDICNIVINEQSI